MNTTLVAVFTSSDDAHRAVDALLNAGFHGDDVSLATPSGATAGDAEPSLVVRDAEKGALVGGLAGLMLGLTEISVPEIGPILAGGWVVTAILGVLAGAAAGGLTGALTEAGISADVANSVTEALAEGRSVITVTVAHSQSMYAEDFVKQFHPARVHVLRHGESSPIRNGLGTV